MHLLYTLGRVGKKQPSTKPSLPSPTALHTRENVRGLAIHADTTPVSPSLVRARIVGERLVRKVYLSVLSVLSVYLSATVPT